MEILFSVDVGFMSVKLDNSSTFCAKGENAHFNAIPLVFSYTVSHHLASIYL
jgi:hypothetical protein